MVFTPQEVAERLRIHPARVVALIKNRKLKGIDAGGGTRKPRYLITQAALDEFLSGGSGSSDRDSKEKPAKAGRKAKRQRIDAGIPQVV